MKTIKFMSILGIILFSACLIFATGFNNPYDYNAGIGWGMYAGLYGIAFAIVVLTKINKYRKDNK